jgi:hypothetical protein
MKYGVHPAGDMTAVRQTGTSEWHRDLCPCRKCRRKRAAVARRQKPRYGQNQLPA